MSIKGRHDVTDMQDISYAAQEAKQYDYDRWLAALFAPEEKRESLFALLAFNTEISRIRETVSEVMLGDIRLQWWRDAIDGLKTNTLKSHPVIDALRTAHKHGALDFDIMQEMIDMRSKDLDPNPIASVQELIDYADGTGGAMHRLMVSVLTGTKKAADLEAANRAGRAYALTGILRAIPFHAQQDLVLLPLDRIEKFGMSPGTVFKLDQRLNFLRLVSELADRAGNELKEARGLARKAGKEIKAATLLNAITGLYLNRLEGVKFDPGHAKLKVGSQRKVMALMVRRYKKG